MVRKIVSSATATVPLYWRGYMLPQELEEGEIVGLMEFDHGYYTVQCCDGRLFQAASNQYRPSFSTITGPKLF